MKKIVRLTESDITRIVKRVMNESPLLLGDSDYESDYRDSSMNEVLGLLNKKTYPDLPGGIVKRRITDYASAKKYTMGTKNSAEHLLRLIEMGGGSVFMYTDRSNDKIFVDTSTKRVYDQLSRVIGKITGDMDDWAMDYFDDNRKSMNESKRPSSVDRTNLPGGIKKRVIDSLESAAYYTKGTRHSSDNIVRHYINKGRDVVMYSKGNNRIFVEPMGNRVFDENDMMVGKITGNMDDWAMDYFENSMNEAKGNRMNEALGLLDKKKYDFPKKKSIGNITGRKITDYASAKRYTMGTRISADDIMRYIDKGHDIYVYINGDKRVYLDSTSGDAYSEKDEHILNVKKGGSFGSQFERLEDYLES
jgi:hypothetical protein